VQTTRIIDGISQEIADNGSIRVYRLEQGKSDVINAWAEHVNQLLQGWDKSQPYLALHDLSYRGVVIQFTTRQKNLLNIAVTDKNLPNVAPVIDQATGFTARVAILVSVQFSGHIAGVFAELYARRHRDSHIEYQVFTERQAALNWLEEWA